MKLTLLRCPLLLAIIFMCSGAGAETPRKDGAVPPTSQVAPPGVSDHLDETTASLVKKIGAARAKGHGLSVLREMYQLMDRWSPVGLTQDRVIELLGKPSSIKGQVMIYRFDNGEGGWQWEFEIEKGVVSKVNKVSLE